jgi:hypothetical protein
MPLDHRRSLEALLGQEVQPGDQEAVQRDVREDRGSVRRDRGIPLLAIERIQFLPTLGPALECGELDVGRREVAGIERRAGVILHRHGDRARRRQMQHDLARRCTGVDRHDRAVRARNRGDDLEPA